ncbi:SDR family NAD(P)-dependent oxidoreductase [Marinivivus vitaminiproducens]|uniref:SDR family NAD(P)-dependent oxidoreductase n=1 Tax=Marinivivus vitaminiproducens TaxID=3035935 RepID=UPI0027A4D2E6|nr:SDR family oxidoreductase [Geminicoccaceae bacterium SCSIO 64248]
MHTIVFSITVIWTISLEEMAVAELAGRTALITGAGSGIGLGIAQAYADEGASVFLADIDSARLEAAVAAARGRGAQASGITADVGDLASVQAMAAAATEALGRIDVVCNNAGILDDLMPAADTTDALWRRVMGINLDGAFYVCRAVLPDMVARGAGIIINTVSISGSRGSRGGFAYTVSKHGLLGLTRSIAVTYGEYGIRCNAISPGSVETNISTGDNWPPIGRTLREKGLSTRPTRAKPNDIAPVAVFLASDRARYVNGHDLVADAGWTVY